MFSIPFVIFTFADVAKYNNKNNMAIPLAIAVVVFIIGASILPKTNKNVSVTKEVAATKAIAEKNEKTPEEIKKEEL